MAARFARRREGRGRGQVPDRGRQAVLPSRRHLRTVRPDSPTASEYHDSGGRPIATSRGWRRAASTPFAPTPCRPPGCSTSPTRYGLRVFIGVALGAARHVPRHQGAAPLDRERVEQAVAACQRHPAVLGYAVGNEIPAPIVRWHGRRPHRTVHALPLRRGEEREHPEALVTYVNFPTTEYLELLLPRLPRLERLSREPADPQRYLARTAEPRRREAAGARRGRARQPAQRRGKQAAVLDWQIRTAGAAGCAGRDPVLLDRRVAPLRTRRSSTGASVSPIAIATPSRRWPPPPRVPDFPFRAGRAGLARWSRSWSAATTARARCARR